MAYNPLQFSKTSDIGVNSYTLTTPSGALWNGINFQGAGEENDFAYLGVNLQTDEAGTLTFEFSQDGTNWSKYPVTDFTVAAGINEVHTAWKGGRYVRPIYSGSDGSKTYFRLKTYYSNHPLPLTAPLNQSINPDQDATVVRSILSGQDTTGNFRNTKVNAFGDLKVQVESPLTAFGEISVAESTPVIQISYPYNINTALVTPTTSSISASITQENQMAKLSTSATSGNSASLETIRTAKYRTGQGIEARYTALFTTGSTAGSEQYAGIGDNTDGYFFGMSGSSFGIWHLNSLDTNTFISQSSFNVDTFDGVGGIGNPSGATLLPDKGNVYAIKFQWLGFGEILFKIEDPTEGIFVPVHKIKYTNANLVPSAKNPTFPLFFKVDNNTNAEDLVLRTASGGVFIEGKNRISGPTNSTGSVKVNGAGTIFFALEGVSTFPSGSANTSKINSYLKNIAFSFDGANNTVASLTVLEDAVITTPTYNYIDTDTSAIRAVNGTYTAGSGKALLKFSVPTGGSISENIFNQELEIRPGKNITFLRGGDAGTSEINVSWVEDF